MYKLFTVLTAQRCCGCRRCRPTVVTYQHERFACRTRVLNDVGVPRLLAEHADADDVRTAPIERQPSIEDKVSTAKERVSVLAPRFDVPLDTAQ